MDNEREDTAREEETLSSVEDRGTVDKQKMGFWIEV